VTTANTRGGGGAGAAASGEYITLTGNNFGPSDAQVNDSTRLKVTYTSGGEGAGGGAGGGGAGVVYTAQGCEVAEPDTQIRCQYQQGGGAGLRWTVQLLDLVSAPSNTTSSYGRPSIGSSERKGDVTQAFGDASAHAAHGPTAGGYFILLRGSNFGEKGLAFVYLDGAPMPDVIPQDKSHEEILISMPRGQGTGHQMTLQVLGQTSTNSLSFDYDPPRVAKRINNDFAVVQLVRGSAGQPVRLSLSSAAS
jgi:hypothetical protein